jgi:hypothetical protein
MPGDAGVTVVITLVCSFLFCMRGCGRIARPAFPAPSVFEGKVMHDSGAKRRGNELVMPGLDPGIHPFS